MNDERSLTFDELVSELVGLIGRPIEVAVFAASGEPSGPVAMFVGGLSGDAAPHRGTEGEHPEVLRMLVGVMTDAKTRDSVTTGMFDISAAAFREAFLIGERLTVNVGDVVLAIREVGA